MTATREPHFSKITLTCYHCGEHCDDDRISSQHKLFCCNGCKLVHELLEENNLCTYYNIEAHPGVSQRLKPTASKFTYLDKPDVAKHFIRFKNDTTSQVEFHLPQIHCNSCLWLLEHLFKINSAVLSSRVDFLEKRIYITYQHEHIELSGVAQLLSAVGYEPALNLELLEGATHAKRNRQPLYKLVVAGFCFANIMMLSFPEYLGLGDTKDAGMQHLFSYLILALSLPVLMFSGAEFFVAAWGSLKARWINIDVPIALAIAVTFARSVYEIVSGTGAGYLDSMSGIIFFMLLGRMFQNKTYENISFERTFKSYFPISVHRISKNTDVEIPLSEVAVGDNLLLPDGGLIPADGILQSTDAQVDYSFVTGESIPVEVAKGELLFAGGRIMGKAASMLVSKRVAQSYLTQLWNNRAFDGTHKQKQSFIHALARHFSWVLLLVAFSSSAFWYFTKASQVLNVFTAVLIVACPCALLLSATFANGNAMRILGRSRIYLRNAEVMEELSRTSQVVFDKTGTLTQSRLKQIKFEGQITTEEEGWVKALTSQSTHPLSKSIHAFIHSGANAQILQFQSFAGQGIRGVVKEHRVALGAASFVRHAAPESDTTHAWLSIDEVIKGRFVFQSEYREELKEVLTALTKQNKDIALLSGDVEASRDELKKYFASSQMHFRQSPTDKMHFIKYKRHSGASVAMVGDGLNDAGAIAQSDVGIAVSEDTNNFYPACDVILHAKSFRLLPSLFRFSKGVHRIIVASFIISILYNVVGLYYATTASLSPLVAAVLMPLSSITIVSFTTLASFVIARRTGIYSHS